MPVEAIGSAEGFRDVVETGSVILAQGETKVRIGVGTRGGKLLLEYDPGISSVSAGPDNNSGIR